MKLGFFFESVGLWEAEIVLPYLAASYFAQADCGNKRIRVQTKSYAMLNPNKRVYVKTQIDHKSNAMQFLANGEKEKALKEFFLEIARNPNDFDALHLAGVLSFELGARERGLSLMEQALEQGSSPFFYNNYGNMLLHMGKQDGAENCYVEALSLSPEYAEAHSNYGNLLMRRREFPAAISAYSTALELKPDLADAWANRGVAQHQLKNFDAAIANLQQAFALNANKDSYHSAYADVCMEMRQFAEAEQLLRRALHINPKSTQAHSSMGRLQILLGEYGLAVDSFMSVIAEDPLNAAAYKNCAIASYRTGDSDSSQRLIKEALKLKPKGVDLYWLDCFMHIPARIESRVQGELIRETLMRKLEHFSSLENKHELDAEMLGNISPFYLMYHGMDDKLIYKRYAALASELLASQSGLGLKQLAATEQGHKKIKVCIVNAQIKSHSVWHSHTEGLYRRLDQNTFELHTINLTGVACPQAEFAKKHSVSYEDVIAEDQFVIARIEEIQADIILYPEVGLHAQTWRLAAQRLCKNQVAMWGNPETTGMQSIDYFISLAGFERAEASSRYSEKIVQIPLREHYYASRNYEPNLLDWSAYGIEREKKIILCAGSSFKYQYQFLEVFEKIHNSFEELQFVFFDQKDAVSEQLKQAITQISESTPNKNRIVFLPWMDEESYYGLMKVSHLMLESLNFSGFNTAIKAIECGLPIVSLRSPFLRENLSAGLLHAIGADAWVADDAAGLMQVFEKLLTNEAWHQEFRTLMLAKRHELFDIDGPVPQLESFFRSIV